MGRRDRRPTIPVLHFGDTDGGQHQIRPGRVDNTEKASFIYELLQSLLQWNQDTEIRYHPQVQHTAT